MKPNLWLLLPGAGLALLMVFAMMECVAAFIAKRPKRVHAIARAELLSQLEALNDKSKSYRLDPANHADLAITFDPVDPEWRARFARVKLSVVYRAKLVLDEERHELRWFEFVRWSGGFVGFQGFLPQAIWSAGFKAGYVDAQFSGVAYGIEHGFPPRLGDKRAYRLDTGALKREVASIASRAGWAFRPKLWWFQVTRRADGKIPRGMLPSRSRYWTELQFWLVMYPVLYVAAIGCIVTGAAGNQPLTWRTAWGPMIAMSVFWWTIWGGIMAIFWALTRRH